MPVPQPAGSAQAPAFRSGVDLVSLNVTVADGTGRYVTDLKEEEFNVFEDGVKQDLTFFTSRKNPIALAMLLDSSASMENKLPILQSAAVSFVRRLQPNDLASIIEFDSTVYVRSEAGGSGSSSHAGRLTSSPPARARPAGAGPSAAASPTARRTRPAAARR